MLYLKHLLATSPLAPGLWHARGLMQRLRALRQPELGLLLQEDALTEQVLRGLIRADSRIVDVGAHIGAVAWRMRRLAPRGHLTLIEASPRRAAWLARRFRGADVHAAAATDHGGQVTFHENTTNPAYSSLTPRHAHGRVQPITIPAVRLDDLLAGARVDFLKIDVEGHEHAVLRGAMDLLRRNRPPILFEAGAAIDDDLDEAQAQAAWSLLTEGLGYQVRAVFDQAYGRPPITRDQFTAYRRYPFLAFNYLALPR